LPVFCAGTAGAGCESESGFATQQPAMPHDGSLQAVLCVVCFAQAVKVGAGAGAKGIHTSKKLNNMAENCFTI